MVSNTKTNKDFLRVQTLSQALPYIQKFQDTIFVIKYGGSSMKDPIIKKETARDLVLLRCVGIKIIVVHGGGPEINAMSQKLNLPVKFVDGYRVTDAKTMEIVEMVLVGKIQKDLVNLINVSGGKAIGLCGKDGRLFFAKPAKKKKKLGFIGEVDSVDISILLPLLEKEFIPVISSVGADIKGQNYNINADDVASVIASSLKATKLILMTDQDGILKDPANSKSIISVLDIKELNKLIKKKVISGGMIPKVNSAVNAIKKGVKSAHILNGSKQHSILLEVFTDGGIGTMITKN